MQLETERLICILYIYAKRVRHCQTYILRRDKKLIQLQYKRWTQSILCATFLFGNTFISTMTFLIVISTLVVVLAIIIYRKWLYNKIGSDNRKRYRTVLYIFQKSCFLLIKHCIWYHFIYILENFT